jgi:uncharacterized surface protein with fasciclin (FAS1) repeats
MDYLVTLTGRAELKQILAHHIITTVIPSGNLIANSTTTATPIQGSALKIVKSADGKVKVNGIGKVIIKRAFTKSPPLTTTLVFPVSFLFWFHFFSSLQAMA